jgi:hypothetical protein
MMTRPPGPDAARSASASKSKRLMAARYSAGTRPVRRWVTEERTAVQRQQREDPVHDSVATPTHKE